MASVAVGAAAGALVGKFARHKVDRGIEQGLGDKLAPGTAVVIAVVDGDDRLAAERASPGHRPRSRRVRVTEQVQATAAGKDREMQGTPTSDSPARPGPKTPARGVPAASGVQGDVEHRACRRGPGG